MYLKAHRPHPCALINACAHQWQEVYGKPTEVSAVEVCAFKCYF